MLAIPLVFANFRLCILAIGHSVVMSEISVGRAASNIPTLRFNAPLDHRTAPYFADEDCLCST